MRHLDVKNGPGRMGPVALAQTRTELCAIVDIGSCDVVDLCAVDFGDCLTTDVCVLDQW
jgi:hypothetical protein